MYSVSTCTMEKCYWHQINQDSVGKGWGGSCWEVSDICSGSQQRSALLHVTMSTQGIQQVMKEEPPSEAAISCLCSETKCQPLPTLALRASFEEDFCRIIFPMLEINPKFFQAHHEGKVPEDKWIQPSNLHFRNTVTISSSLKYIQRDYSTGTPEREGERERICSGCQMYLRVKVQEDL